MTPKPSLPEQLRTQLRALLRTKQQLLVTPTERPAASQLLSHIGGDPYFEAGETWPTNPKTGQPLELIFQLVNLEGNMPWPFEAQVVQFYHNYWGELPFDDGHEPLDFCLKTYPRLRPAQLVQVPRPAALPSIGFSRIHTQLGPSLPDDDELADIAPELQVLCEQLNPEDWWTAYNAAVTELAGEPDLGGWAATRSGCKVPTPRAHSGCNLIARLSSPGAMPACCTSSSMATTITLFPSNCKAVNEYRTAAQRRASAG